MQGNDLRFAGSEKIYAFAQFIIECLYPVQVANNVYQAHEPDDCVM